MKLMAAVSAALLCAAVPVSAADAAADADADGDAQFLEMAEAACRSDDFDAFLWPFANSRAVRERYSAPRIAAGGERDSRDLPRGTYLAGGDFPILMIDFSYVTAESFRRFEAGDGDASRLAYVDVEINTAQDERRRVDWAPARFAPGEGDGPGTLIEKTGPGGYLLFSPTGDCWQLTADIREAGGAS
ncbi:MAG: hypothetical protein DI569_02795 [Sphingopyxis macrogoltabida]|uniref:Secreted protein n=1 Tax=Sphingopyxis macrogoltabida TaxID=33050 RepID=A0A2W5L3H7_SPHMC|nr:MAG: hypothetical protein DI569_02795 [Sphingopyxis macrogoltabida]